MVPKERLVNMYQVKVDPHTHTIYSGHAFSTVGENAAEAARLGLEGIGMTDHFGIMTPRKEGGQLDLGPLMNKAALPPRVYGVRVLQGVEIDIMDFNGELAFWHDEAQFGGKGLSIGETVLKTRDLVIASLHFFPGCKTGNVQMNTQMYIGALENPYVDILGHPCRPGVPFEMREVVRAARDNGKFLEINEHSFDTTEAVPRCRELAICCAEENCPVVVSSDAHSAWMIGQFPRVFEMFAEIGFPQALIANESLEKMARLRGKEW